MNSVKFQGKKLMSRCLLQEFPSNLMVRTLQYHCSEGWGGAVGLIPGGELRFQKSRGTAKKKKSKHYCVSIN